MSTIQPIAGQSPYRGRLATLLRPGLFGRMLSSLLDWQSRAGERHRLATLDDHMLKDLGLTRADVEHEVRKPFWRG
jgi:uncharacterized protein YjiS (DUF1127 family)